MMIRTIILFLFCFLITGPVHAEPLPSLNYSHFLQIPVLHNGRVKPLDSFAGIHLQILSGKRSLPNMKAVPWLAEMLLAPERAAKREIFYISNPDVLSSFGLEKRRAHLYSFEELFNPVVLHAQNIEAIYAQPPEERTAAQEQILALYEKILYYLDISRSLSQLLPDFTPSSASLAKSLRADEGQALTYLQMLPKIDVLRAAIKPLPGYNTEQLEQMSPEEVQILVFAYKMKEIEQEHTSRLFRFIPPQWNVETGSGEDELWFTPWELFQRGQGSPQTAEFLDLWTALASAYRAGDTEKFSATAKTIQNVSISMAGAAMNGEKLALEERYNNWNLFTYSLGFYIFSFLLLLAGGLFWQRRMQNFSFISLLLAAGLHTAGIVMRMIIMGRPPVTNLYESILFVGLVAALFALIMEWRRRDGSGLIIGSVCGALLQFLGMRFAAGSDTMGMLQAVLDTNFWLATHVVTITIGYGCCLVGGLIAHIYAYTRIAKPDDKERLAALAKNIRGAALVALFFAALGTILGGIWADQSWGRFWCWDPKENGALLICLWLTWLIHGRFAGTIREDGFAIGMIITNVIVALAWFGVNLLGVGLHSYGFTQSAGLGLALFCGIEILIAASAFGISRKSPLI